MKVPGSWAVTPKSCVSRKACEHERHGQAYDDADGDEAHALAEDERNEVARRRPERISQSDLVRSFGDRKRHDAVEADERQHERYGGEDAGEEHREALAGHGLGDDRRHRLQASGRLIRVELEDRGACHCRVARGVARSLHDDKHLCRRLGELWDTYTCGRTTPSSAVCRVSPTTPMTVYHGPF